MEAELQEVERIYQTNVQRLNAYITRLLQQVQRMRWPTYYKNYYRRRISSWKQRYMNYLAQMRDSEIAAIRAKYAKPVHRRKQACLVGINYVGSNYALNGCVNDVYKFGRLLVSKYGYDAKDIRIVTNKQASRTNILREFTQLVHNAVSGDTICFSFSGHGVYVQDRNGDEGDGRDELIVSSDFYAILDDELRAIINKHLKPGVKMFALFDNCHSGTILDLKYQHLKAGEPVLKIDDKTAETSGQVVCISGCRDDQVSMDAYLDGKYNGAMTWALVETLSQSNDLTWQEGLVQLRQKLASRGFQQRPQLTSGQNLTIGQDKIAL